jgi:hypothetical protein
MVPCRTIGFPVLEEVRFRESLIVAGFPEASTKPGETPPPSPASSRVSLSFFTTLRGIKRYIP